MVSLDVWQTKGLHTDSADLRQLKELVRRKCGSIARLVYTRSFWRLRANTKSCIRRRAHFPDKPVQRYEVTERRVVRARLALRN
jgi:hypothetical protein